MAAREGKKSNRKKFSKRRSRGRSNREYDQQVIDISRVSRTVKGGKRMRFRALVVIGDHNGKVGVGLRKGLDVPDAISKAVDEAKKSMVEVKLVDGTIPHEIKEKFKASQVFLKPASEGTGVIAGGAVRQLLDLSGVKNVLSKTYGSRNKVNTVMAAFNALKKMKTLEDKQKLLK